MTMRHACSPLPPAPAHSERQKQQEQEYKQKQKYAPLASSSSSYTHPTASLTKQNSHLNGISNSSNASSFAPSLVGHDEAHPDKPHPTRTPHGIRNGHGHGTVRDPDPEPETEQEHEDSSKTIGTGTGIVKLERRSPPPSTGSSRSGDKMHGTSIGTPPLSSSTSSALGSASTSAPAYGTPNSHPNPNSTTPQTAPNATTMIRASCRLCRARKLKCDGRPAALGGCLRCEKAGRSAECVYGEFPYPLSALRALSLSLSYLAVGAAQSLAAERGASRSLTHSPSSIPLPLPLPLPITYPISSPHNLT